MAKGEAPIITPKRWCGDLQLQPTREGPEQVQIKSHGREEARHSLSDLKYLWSKAPQSEGQAVVLHPTGLLSLGVKKMGSST